MPPKKVVKRLNSKAMKMTLSSSLDDEGQVLIKASPIFERELNHILDEIEDKAKNIVLHSHRKYSKGGALRHSIERTPIKRLPGGPRISGTVTAGSAEVNYARYVHEGTEPHKIAAHDDEHPLSFRWRYRKGRVSKDVWVPVKRATKDGRGIRGFTFRNRLDGNREYTRLYRRKGRWAVGDIADRKVVVQEVNHPGQDGHPFLNIAADIVVRKYGGRVMYRDRRWKRI